MEVKKANDIGRLNTLLALSQHYVELINNQVKLADLLRGSASGIQCVNETYAGLDIKLRDVSYEIEKYHCDLVDKRAKTCSHCSRHSLTLAKQLIIGNVHDHNTGKFG